MSDANTNQALSEAAGYIAAAIATAYGFGEAAPVVDEVVQSIASALLGGDDDKYQQEVLSRLTVIENKVDQIIRFLNVNLKDVIGQVIDEKTIQDTILTLHSDSIALRAGVTVYLSLPEPTRYDADRLLDKTEFVLKSGFQLLARSPLRFIVALNYIAQSFSALRMVRDFNPSVYDGALSTWADAYLKELRPWVTPNLPANPNSFVDALAHWKADLGQAQAIMVDFTQAGPGNTIKYLVAVGDRGPGTDTSWGFFTNYVWNGDGATSSQFLNESPTVPKLPVPATREALKPLADLAGAKVHPTIDVFYGPVAGIMHAPEFWNYWSTTWGGAFYHSAGVLKDAPGRIAALEFAVSVLTPLRDGLAHLAALNQLYIAAAANAKAERAAV